MINRYKHLIPQEMLNKVASALSDLKAANQLPFAEEVNWLLDEKWDYKRHFEGGEDYRGPLDPRRPRWTSDKWDGIGDRKVVVE